MESIRKKYSSEDTATKQITLKSGEKPFIEKEKPRWRLSDMGIEASCGVGGSLVCALVGAMIGSWFHTVGDTSQAGNDIAYTAVMIGLGIGHTVGTGVGVIAGGNWRDVKGSSLLAIIGGVAAEIPAIIMFSNKKTVSTTIFLAVVPSIVSTLCYNLMGKF